MALALMARMRSGLPKIAFFRESGSPTHPASSDFTLPLVFHGQLPWPATRDDFLRQRPPGDIYSFSGGNEWTIVDLDPTHRVLRITGYSERSHRAGRALPISAR